MASLNDVLKEILEKDFEKEDVEKVVDQVESNDENKETPRTVSAEAQLKATSKIAFMKNTESTAKQ